MASPAERGAMRISLARRRRARGLATVEVLVAVAIVLMVGTIGIVSFGGTARGELRAEAADMALFLQQTRLRALELGRPIEVLLSASDRTLLAGGETHVIARDITVQPDEARLILEPSGGSDGLIVTLSKGDHSATVTLDWLTGRVAVQ